MRNEMPEAQVTAIQTTRSRALEWLDTMRISGYSYTNSTYNRPVKYPGMTLPATYNALCCLRLLGALQEWSEENRRAAAVFLNGFQTMSGAYRMPEMRLEDLYYPTFEYDDFHITNYTLGALIGLGGEPKYPMDFLKLYNTPERLSEWLLRRDFEQPWTEGNYIVNLASFFLWEFRRGEPHYKTLLDQLLEWHLENQNVYGYWHNQISSDAVSAMAGAAHNFHLFYVLNLPVPRYRVIIDHCLSMPNELSTACVDIDIVDILAHFIVYGYRREEIREYLSKKLSDLLNMQNPDGGFYDTQSGIRLFDGWRVYEEPQGLSNCFATWFRMAAIGMCVCALYPGCADDWHFRTDIGIGYYNREYLCKGFDEPEERPAKRHICAEAAVQADHVCSEELTRVIERLNRRFAAKQGTLVCRFSVEGDGSFTLDLSAAPKVRAGWRDAADLSVILPMKTLNGILEGRLSPTVAYALRKLKLRGDMGKALKLAALFGEKGA